VCVCVCVCVCVLLDMASPPRGRRHVHGSAIHGDPRDGVAAQLDDQRLDECITQVFRSVAEKRSESSTKMAALSYVYGCSALLSLRRLRGEAGLSSPLRLRCIRSSPEEGERISRSDLPTQAMRGAASHRSRTPPHLHLVFTLYFLTALLLGLTIQC
jgi:hypothetical protein